MNQNSTRNKIKLMNIYRSKFSTTMKPMAKWKIFTQCNYECSYCRSNNKSDQFSTSLSSDALVSMISRVVPKGWRIYLTGGELTIAKDMLEQIIAKLAEADYEIRLISNFSATIDDYVHLTEISKGRFLSLFLTRHPYYSSSYEFSDKVCNLRQNLPKWCNILVRQVVLPTKQSMKEFISLSKEINAVGVESHPLRLVKFNLRERKFANYQNEELKDLSHQVFSNVPFHPNRKNTSCPAGYEYLYIDQFMDVYRCIPYKSCSDGLMGNLKDEKVSLLKEPTICGLDVCHCVPGR